MSEMTPSPRSRVAQWITAVAFIGCLGVGLWFSLNPCIYRGERTSCVSDESGTRCVELIPPGSCTGSLVDHEGPGAFLVLAIPLLFVGTGFVAARFAQPIVLWVISGMLLVFSVLGVFTVGLFILPFALLLLVAAGLVQLASDRARWAAGAAAARE